jgi:hypothetical protein
MSGRLDGRLGKAWAALHPGAQVEARRLVRAMQEDVMRAYPGEDHDAYQARYDIAQALFAADRGEVMPAHPPFPPRLAELVASVTTWRARGERWP